MFTDFTGKRPMGDVLNSLGCWPEYLGTQQELNRNLAPGVAGAILLWESGKRGVRNSLGMSTSGYTRVLTEQDCTRRKNTLEPRYKGRKDIKWLITALFVLPKN